MTPAQNDSTPAEQTRPAEQTQPEQPVTPAQNNPPAEQPQPENPVQPAPPEQPVQPEPQEPPVLPANPDQSDDPGLILPPSDGTEDPAEPENPAEDVPLPEKPPVRGVVEDEPFSTRYPYRRVRMNPEEGIRAPAAGTLIWPMPKSPFQQMLEE